MGPVLGLTFGFSIRDWPLVKKSIRNEVLALLGCIVIGALAGLGSAFTNVAEEWYESNHVLWMADLLVN